MPRRLFGVAVTMFSLGSLLLSSSCKTSASDMVAAAIATQLGITTQPSAAVANGAALAQQPILQLRDAAGKAVSQAGVVVTASIGSGGGTLGGTTTASTNASGVAAFTNLAISGVVGARTLSFSAPSLASAASNSIALTAGAASQLAIATPPSPAPASGAAFAQQPVIQLSDASANAVAQAGVVVTASIASGGGTLGGATTAITNAGGAAAFTDLSVSGTVGNRVLSFSAPALTGVSSSTLSVTAGAAARLSMTTQPSAAAVSAAAFAQQPVIQLLDQALNAVSQAGVVVTAAIASGGGTLGGATTATTTAGGAATFAALSITGSAGNRTLTFSAPSLASVTSGTVAVADALPNFAGMWVGQWVDTRYSVSGAITNVVLTQTATGMTGTGTINLTSLGLGIQSGTATGTIVGNAVTFSFSAATIGSGNGTLNGASGTGSGSITALALGAFTFTGTLSTTVIDGTFQFTSATGGFGTMHLTKQ